LNWDQQEARLRVINMFSGNSRVTTAGDEPRVAGAWPVTVIVFHPRERRAKCTVRPLRGRADIAFCNFPRMPYDLAGYVRLGLGGPVLGADDADRGLLVLDGTWRHVEPMQRAHSAIPIRSLPPLVTAYPRSSKVRSDPDGGLATVEAIYAAYRLLGRDTTGLLDHYHWAAEFVERNREFWPATGAVAANPFKTPIEGGIVV
jgi:pre-rRNA-processing protein TSR3